MSKGYRAVLFDDYALTHKKSAFSHKPYPAKYHWSGHNDAKLQSKSSHDDKGSSQKVAINKPDNGKSEQRFS